MWAALTAPLLLAACATPPNGPAASAPPGTVLSRLPPDSPGAATLTPERQPSEAEQARRYNEIDRQALQEQEQLIESRRIAAAAAAAAPRYGDYSDPWYPSYYGGYRGGWGYPRSGWSVSGGNGWGW